MTEASGERQTSPGSTTTADFVSLHDREPGREIFRRDVVQGLSQTPKRIPSKYFYDARGCELFDAICELDEYYLTRTELAIMRQSGEDIARHLGPDCLLIEYGSGSSVKTRLLLDDIQRPSGYVPVDIARDHLRQTARDLSAAYAELDVLPVCADFTQPFDLPPTRVRPSRRIVYFPGSTIGNLQRDEACKLLRGMARVAGEGGGLLIGIDLKKDVRRLEAAYNDARGVTAEFNLNLLRRVNRELGADFRLDRFQHRAPYNARQGRIEMLLVSTIDQRVHIGGDRFDFKRGEAICTEYSHKYDLEDFGRLAAGAGWSLCTAWTDDESLFAVVYLAADAGVR